MHRGLVATGWLAALTGCSGAFGLDSLKPLDEYDAGSSDGTTPDAAVDGSGPSDPSLVGWWRFDEGSGTTASDSSSMGNHGTLHGGATWTTGKHGSALALDGVSGMVEIPWSTSLDFTTTLTVAMWVNTTQTTTSDARLISRDWGFDVKLNGPARHPQLSLSKASGGDGYAMLGYSLPLGEWHHVAFTFDQGPPVAYIDGARATFADVSGFDATTAVGSHQNPLHIGFMGTSFLPGIVDDVRLYKRALFDAEIAALAQ